MNPLSRQIAAWLGRWPIALVAALALAALLTLPGLGATGLWEPQERQAAERAAPPAGAAAEAVTGQLRNAVAALGGALATAAQPAQPGERPRAAEPCARTAPKDALARSLTPRAIAWGRDHVGDDDGGRRLPLALLGLLTMLATTGIAIRAAGARAGVVTAVALGAMPLFVLQSRTLTSEIGTACGAALIVYALVALARPARGALVWTLLDALVATAALALGVAIGFLGGGALLGLVVPLGAVAAAGGLGVYAVRAALRREPVLGHAPAVLATIAVIGLVALLAYQMFEAVPPYPGITPPAREVLGRAIIADGCWSWALGGTWRPEDDVRFIFDSAFEQIAYGTLPWGVVAPVAVFALLRDPDARRRAVGALALAWAGGAWIATEAFQRKIGFTIWAGFPALAIAVGVWLDGVLARRARGEREPFAGGAGAILVGLFVVLAVVDLGKDLQSFAEKLTSLLVDTKNVTYPADVTWLGVALKRWVLVLPALVALAFALALGVWRAGEDPRARRRQRVAGALAAAALGLSVVIGAFWAFAWQPRLGEHLSSRAMFETYARLRRPGEPLVIMGDLGSAARAYAGDDWEPAANRGKLVETLKRTDARVFAIAPQTELCALHREIGEHRYYVVEDRNVRNLLFSNRLDADAADLNPLATMIAHKEPAGITTRPKGKVMFDNRIELIGWDIPASVRRGGDLDVVLYYKVHQTVAGNWKSLMHFDGKLRFNGDHPPIQDRCPTSTWQPGDYIIDRHTLTAGSKSFPRGDYDLWIGFFTGAAPSFRNMPVSQAPGDMRDSVDRVKITTIQVR